MTYYAGHNFFAGMEMDMAIGEFGAIVKKLRNDRNWTQSELAERAGVRLSTVQKAEASKEKHMHWRNYIGLAKAFGMTEEELDAAWQGDMTTLTLSIPQSVLKKIVARTARHQQVDHVAADLLSRAVEEAAPPMRIAAMKYPQPPKKKKSGDKHS